MLGFLIKNYFLIERVTFINGCPFPLSVAIDLIKDQHSIVGTCIGYLKFSEQELTDAKSILYKDPTYHPNANGSEYSNGGRLIRFINDTRVQVDEELMDDPVVDQLMEVMGIKHPISKLSKLSPSD